MATLPERLSARPVGRELLPREVVAMHQRQSIAAAAIAVFAKRGYQGTRIRHIIAAAKVGVGKFYELFENKEDCFLACFEMIVAEAREKVAAALPAEPWSEQVLAALRVLLASIAEQPLAARVALAEVQTAGPEALARYEALTAEAAAFLRGGRAGSELAADLPDTFDEAIVGGLVWMLRQRVVIGETAQAEELLPEVAEIVLGPYLGEAEAARLVLA